MMKMSRLGNFRDHRRKVLGAIVVFHETGSSARSASDVARIHDK